MYLMTNNKESKLGTTPLPDGVVRVFRDNGRDGLSYLTQQAIKYIPIGDKIELNLGPDPEVVFELIKLRASRDEIWMQINGTNKFKQVGGDDDRDRSRTRRVVGWDDHSTLPPADPQLHGQADRCRNPPHASTATSTSAASSSRSCIDFQTVEFTRKVDPARRRTCCYEVVQHQGRNAKQNNVTLETAEIK